MRTYESHNFTFSENYLLRASIRSCHSPASLTSKLPMAFQMNANIFQGVQNTACARPRLPQGLISSLCPLPGHSEYLPLLQLPENIKRVPILQLLHLRGLLSLSLVCSSHRRLFLTRKLPAQLVHLREIFSNHSLKSNIPTPFFSS